VAAKIVTVVAAALVDAAGHVLVAQRPSGSNLAGLWEFPGGKIDAGETPEAALVRELAEELGIATRTEDFETIGFVSHGYGDFHLLLLLYLCRHWAGAPHGQEGQPLRWEAPEALTMLAMPPADIPLCAALIRHLSHR
jgi:8-oxo-dGTP diphosphatase